MKLYVAAILAIVFLENFNVHIVRETLGSQTMALSSCVDLDPSVIHIRRLADYEIQTRPIKAVILITRRGVKVCVPHDRDWVKEVVKKLDERKAKKEKMTIRRPTAVTS
ncbi:lymphotactin-like [Sceloporus undulatus]|uniref:lymphotactin-like n=1 Tax=Sceloporus undulatus TaxID=8520 RepID=UPI001C4CAED2|nr:lymphotactin-like [Sceloporus undulatus]